jgi:integrase
VRAPSETFALTWQCIDWEREWVTIVSPKTEHHPGKGTRQIPLFPELRPYLEAVFDEAPAGTIYVIGKRLC